MSSLQDQVDAMIAKAASAEKSEDALKFSQAALNAAHTKHALVEPQKQKDREIK